MKNAVSLGYSDQPVPVV